MIQVPSHAGGMLECADPEPVAAVLPAAASVVPDTECVWVCDALPDVNVWVWAPLLVVAVAVCA